jgi:hypothetical protein
MSLKTSTRAPVAGYPVTGAGLGLRRVHLDELYRAVPEPVAFLEVAPENWINVGGAYGRKFRAISERMPVVCHGLSLDIGGPAPLDIEFLRTLKRFLDAHQVPCYTEHLSYCGDGGHLYDLMPIPFTADAVHYVAGRIRTVQDVLERPIAMENVSYYAAPGQEMSEGEFINAVLAEADCGLHLDVNNIYVNSINHRYDPLAFLKALPGGRIWYAHVAGHYVEAEDLRVDTHGADVIDPVWQLLAEAYACFGVFPTLLERDFNLPPVTELVAEVCHIDRLQRQAQPHGRRHAQPLRRAA